MITESDWARLARLHTGECDPSEAEDLRRWVEADPERTEALEFMGATAALKPAPQMRDTETAWARLVSRRRARLLRAPLLRRVTADAAPSRRSPRLLLGVGLAAAATLLLLVRVIGPRNPGLAPAPTGPTLELSTLPGERSTVPLPDGSRVVLAPLSTMAYTPPTASGTPRRVTLTGAAYFEVQHDTLHPFLVETTSGTIRDIGTAFTVEEYPADGRLEVMVSEGIVGLSRTADTSGAGPETPVHRGQLGTIHGDGAIVVRPVAVDDYLAWTTGRLVFNRMPLSDVLVRLSRWYAVNAAADPALASARVTATFADESATEALGALATSLNARLVVVGDTLRLHAR